jgi:hypothetical protein
MRIKGELQGLGIRVSATTIAMLLRSHGIGPTPRRGLTWNEFLKAQAQGIIACDFFTVETALLKTCGVQKLRQVNCSTPTAAVRSALLLSYGQRLGGSHTPLARGGWLPTTSSVSAQTSAATRVGGSGASRLWRAVKLTISFSKAG